MSSSPSSSSKKALRPPVEGLGLSLCGGGITGAMYQVGCLAALEEALEDFHATDFSVFVGTASGATVAVALSGGLPATRLYRALLDPSDDLFPLQRNHLLRLDNKEWRRVWGSALRATRHLVSSASSNPLDLNVWTELDRFTDSLPAGIFKLDAYERFFSEFMRRRNISSSFARLDRTLALIANDLDAGKQVAFGVGAHRHVPIARAVIASMALPILYAPVRVEDRDYVEGGLGEVAHADVAESLGADLVIIINPMVPVAPDISETDVPTGHGRRGRVRDKGLLWVASQARRMHTDSRFKRALADFRREHPHTEVVLLEPDPDDALMFMHSPMNFAARRVILEDGFRSTLRRLRAPDSVLAQALAAKGLHLRNHPGSDA